MPAIKIKRKDGKGWWLIGNERDYLQYLRTDGSRELTGLWDTGQIYGIKTPYIVMDTDFVDSSEEGRLQWNAEDGTLEYGLPGGNVTLQIGQEQLVKCSNKSGEDILNGKVVYVSGAQGNRPTIALASSDQGTGKVPIGVATEDIDDNADGYVNVGGLVRDMDTSAISDGGIAFLSETTPGDLRPSPPDAPNYTTVVGYCLFSNPESGILFVRILSSPRMQSLSDVDHTPPSVDGQYYQWKMGNSRFELAEEIRSFHNGTFRESFDALLTSNGTVITLSLEKSNGGDLTMQFSDGDTTLDCDPPQTIGITPGTDASPIGYMVFIPQDTKTLTVDTAWPVFTEHIKVTYLLVPSATFVQDHGGVYVNQNWNDHLSSGGSEDQGHMAHMCVRLRQQGASWYSGVSANGTTSYFDFGASSVYWKSAEGIISQLHPHLFSAQDTSGTDIMLVTNDPDQAYTHVQNLFTGITEDSTGSTILNNRYFSLVFWGVINKSGEYSGVLCNLPSGFYTLVGEALIDGDGYDDYNFPREYDIESGTAFLIARVVFQMGTTDWTHIQTDDLRGKSPFRFAGGGAVNDHGSLGGLGGDDHIQYLLVDGSRGLSADWDVGANMIRIDEVRSRIGTDTGLRLSNRGNNNFIFIEDGSDSIGFNVAEPSRTMDIFSAGLFAYTVMKLEGSGAYCWINFLDAGTTDEDKVRIGSYGDHLMFLAGGVERFRLTSGGGVESGGDFVVKDEDDMASNSAIHLVTQQSVKAYVDGLTGSSIDHGSIGGLSDDDHLQYVPVDGSRGINELAPDYPLQVTGVSAGADVILLCLQNDSVTTSSGAGIRLVASTDPDNAGFGVSEIIATRDVSGNSDILFKSRSSVDGYGTRLKIDYDGNVIQTLRKFMINETVNTNMTHGITINQGSVDDEILAFKSSDVTHAGTSVTEEDTYGFFSKIAAGTGGLFMVGVSEGAPNKGIEMVGLVTTNITARDSNADGCVNIRGGKITGGGIGSNDANANLLTVQDSAATRWIVDAEGDTWQSGSITMGGDIFMTETAPAIHMYCTGNSDYKVRLGAHWQDEVLNLTVGPVEIEYKILTTEGFDTPENTFIWSNNAKTMAFMSGKVLINDDANAKMTIGLTINQGEADDEILAFKSSDVGHGGDGSTETDTFGYFKKVADTSGGLSIVGLRDADGNNRGALQLIAALAEDVDTTKSNTGRALMELVGKQISGDAPANVVASGNILAIRGRIGGTDLSVWLVDEDGDTWQSGHVYVELDKGLYLDGTGPMIYAATGSNDTHIGKNLGSARPRMEFANSLCKIYDEAEDTTMQTWSESGAITMTPTTYVRIDPRLMLNTNTNNKMTYGITIAQGGADNQILAFKSSDVTHVITDRAIEDVYGFMQKVTGVAGGLDIWGIRSTDGNAVRITGGSASATPASPGVLIRGGKWDGANDYTTADDGDLVMVLTNWSQEAISIYGGPQVVIGNVGEYNTWQTSGLTIDQRTNDDEILALKSTDVGHTMTDLTEADTFFAMSKVSPSTGGAWLMGYNVSTYGILIEGRHSAADTTKTTSGLASVILRGSLQTGNEVGFMSADGNIVAMCNYTSTKWILNAEGDTWQSGKATIQELLFIDGGSTVDIIRDEDDMASDDAAALATQQSIKAYVNLQDGLEGVKSNEILSTSTVDELTALIPDDAYYIVISWVNASTDTINEPPILQFADAGGYETSGYVTMLSYLASASHAVTSLTNGIHLYPVAAYAADQNLSGQIILFRYSVSSQYWYCNGHCQGEGQTALVQIASRKNTTTAITSVRVTTPGGIATLDGYYSISWR